MSFAPSIAPQLSKLPQENQTLPAGGEDATAWPCLGSRALDTDTQLPNLGRGEGGGGGGVSQSFWSGPFKRRGGSAYLCSSAAVASLPAQADSRFVYTAAGLEGPPASLSAKQGSITNLN